jgi:hypothetical protein
MLSTFFFTPSKGFMCLSKRSPGLRLRLTPVAVASPRTRQGGIEHTNFFIVHIEWCITFFHRCKNSNNWIFSDVIYEKDWW